MMRITCALASLCLVLATGCQTNTGHRDHAGTGGGFIDSAHEGAYGQGGSDYPEGDYRNTLSNPGY